MINDRGSKAISESKRGGGEERRGGYFAKLSCDFLFANRLSVERKGREGGRKGGD